MVTGDLPAEDDGDLVGSADGAAGVEQAFTEGVQRSPPLKDQIVTVLNLSEKQPMPAGRIFMLPCGEEGSKCSQPLLATGQKVLRGK